MDGHCSRQHDLRKGHHSLIKREQCCPHSWPAVGGQHWKVTHSVICAQDSNSYQRNQQIGQGALNVLTGPSRCALFFADRFTINGCVAVLISWNVRLNCRRCITKSETLTRNWIGYLCNEKYQTLSTVLFWPGSTPLNLRVVCVSACLHMEKPGGESRTKTGGRMGGSV